jgi:hypothetical protein
MHTGNEQQRAPRMAAVAPVPSDYPQPVCPQFRPLAEETQYPVRGYCVPLRHPEWFAIPTIEEYGSYCTDPSFARCPWFRHTDNA